MEDFDGTKLRIDEALKDREKGEARIGRTKTKESDSSVPVPPDLSREIAAWIAAHPERNNPRAFLFPSRRETPYSVGNYLKRYLKPLAERVGIHDLTHQAFRRTSSTHIQDYARVKDLQGHLRHTNPQTTLKHYTKVIPESLRAAVAALDENIAAAANESKQRRSKGLSKEASTNSKGQRAAALLSVVCVMAPAFAGESLNMREYEERCGQFVLGQPLNRLNKHKADRLRAVSELFPEIIDPALDDDSQPSCSAAEALERQPSVHQSKTREPRACTTESSISV